MISFGFSLGRKLLRFRSMLTNDTASVILTDDSGSPLTGDFPS